MTKIYNRILFIPLFFIISCSFEPNEQKQNLASNDSTIEAKVVSSYDNSATDSLFNSSLLKKKPADNKFIVGEFDGVKGIDTIFQTVYSGKTSTVVDSVVCRSNGRDVYMDWGYAENITTKLSINNNPSLTIGKDLCASFSFLVNIGDVNNDGVDEVAFVADYFDFSNLNSMNIYSVCNGEWSKCFSFSVNEMYMAQNDKVNEIEGVLEKRNGEWFYADYDEFLKGDTEEMPFKKLVIEKCPK